MHFSNGIGGSECYRENFDVPSPPGCRSRSAANRIVFEALASYKGFGAHIGVWPYISGRRDNPDIATYLGYGDLKLSYRHKRHLIELEVKPFFSDYRQYRASMRTGYSYAINKFVSMYVQHFYGYGDSLYEYNIISHRLGVGFRATSF